MTLDKLARFIRPALGAIAALTAGACAAQDVQSPALAAEIAPENYQPGPALWKLADGDTTIYLFGTVHALPATVDWYDQRIERAFTSSSELVTEIDLADQAAAAQAISAQAMLPAGQNLRDLMSEEDRAEYEAGLVSLGLPEPALDQMEPWFAAMTLSLLPVLQSGYSADSGVEMALETRAADKTRGALETIDQQIALFDTLTLENQLEYLDQTVAAIPEAATSLDAMVAEWIEGDAAELANLLNSEMDNPELYNRLLVERNANWVDWIEQRLQQPGTVFIAVGAGHLGGRGSVQAQLAERGYEVTRVWQ